MGQRGPKKDETREQAIMWVDTKAVVESWNKLRLASANQVVNDNMSLRYKTKEENKR